MNKDQQIQESLKIFRKSGKEYMKIFWEVDEKYCFPSIENYTYEEMMRDERELNKRELIHLKNELSYLELTSSHVGGNWKDMLKEKIALTEMLYQKYQKICEELGIE